MFAATPHKNFQRHQCSTVSSTVAVTSEAMDGVAPELSPGWAIEERAAIGLLAQRIQRKKYMLLPEQGAAD